MPRISGIALALAAIGAPLGQSLNPSIERYIASKNHKSETSGAEVQSSVVTPSLRSLTTACEPDLGIYTQCELFELSLNPDATGTYDATGASACALYTINGDACIEECFNSTYAVIVFQKSCECDPELLTTTYSYDFDYSEISCASDDDDDDTCFSGDSVVQLASGATKAMADLKVGDSVLSADAAGKLSFSDVVFLPHGTNSKKADFVAVTTESGKIIKATPSHLLQACDGSLVQAKAASCLRTVDGAESVKSIDRFMAEGIYTAVTLKNEFLVVDGVVASPFALAHTLADAYYNAHRALYTVSPSLVKVPSMVSANSLVGAAAVYVVRSLRSLHQGTKSMIF